MMVGLFACHAFNADSLPLNQQFPMKINAPCRENDHPLKNDRYKSKRTRTIKKDKPKQTSYSENLAASLSQHFRSLYHADVSPRRRGKLAAKRPPPSATIPASQDILLRLSTTYLDHCHGSRDRRCRGRHVCGGVAGAERGAHLAGDGAREDIVAGDSGPVEAVRGARFAVGVIAVARERRDAGRGRDDDRRGRRLRDSEGHDADSRGGEQSKNGSEHFFSVPSVSVS